MFFLTVGTFPYPEEQRSTRNKMEKKYKNTNKLINETSPYLLQHAHNPVDWYPWGEEALAKAKKENKPIFLSIGYAACHWCHVMERESFENEEIANILNKNFVSIKVDREERPDLDEIYMAAVVALTGRGGWPMTVFLTPSLKPFTGGTYFPPEDKWGLTGFKSLITLISEKWKNKDERDSLIKNADALSKVVEERTSGVVSIDSEANLSKELLDRAVRQIKASFDEKWGGFGDAPKFPPSNTIAILLRGNKESLEMATFTLDKMYQGGMYDHLAGGFHRYSTDERWLVPHFEKMLYDNAQLAFVYMEAYQLTGNKRYARVAQEIFDYEMMYMTDSAGGIYATEDADSEGKEGIFYLWEYDELEKILGKDDTKMFSKYYSIKKSGNFSSHEPYHKGLNILNIQHDPMKIAKELKMKETELEDALASMRKKLAKVRDKRVRPGLDDKIITSWNALMISAYARGFQVFEDKRYSQAAENAATFIMDNMTTEDGRLLRTHRNGKSKFYAYLEDYAYTVRAFIDLYEAGFEEKWLNTADGLAKEMMDQFWDNRTAGFFNTSKYHTNLIVRAKSVHDGAIPSPAAVATNALLRLSKLLDKENYFHKAKQMLKANHIYMERFPQGYLSLLSCVDFLVYPAKEIAIVGKMHSEDTKNLLRAVNSHFIPNMIIAFIDPDQPDAQKLTKKIPLLANRNLVDGKATAYVCENFACKLPVTTPEALLEQLGVRQKSYN
jgi:uncharacterized protein YyaL (SSP411 family)